MKILKVHNCTPLFQILRTDIETYLIRIKPWDGMGLSALELSN